MQLFVSINIHIWEFLHYNTLSICICIYRQLLFIEEEFFLQGWINLQVIIVMQDYFQKQNPKRYYVPCLM